MQTRHYTLDLETMGNGPTAVIAAIRAMLLRLRSK